MSSFCSTSTPAVSEPRTATTATTTAAGFLDGAAFGAYGTDVRRGESWCLYADIGQSKVNTKNYNSDCLLLAKMHTHAIRLGLTFAGLHALKPPVINVSVAGTSAVLEPSTARSATTDSAGFPERAALWAHHRANNRSCD